MDGWMDAMGWDGMGWDGWVHGWMDGWMAREDLIICLVALIDF